MRVPAIGELFEEKYRIDRTIGEGGFGLVLLATTLSTGRPVAIKLLKPRSGELGVTRARRFLREMRAIAQLQSPHTLTLYDFGRTEAGLLFMVCEYVEGEDLLELITRRGTLAEYEVVWILYQALLSLEEAHRMGILHRDIKPPNIRIFQYEADPLRVKLLDFGLAKSLDADEARLTGTGKVIGTPRYMSPEQLLGRDLTPASDIFGLGVVAIEMLLGRAATAVEIGAKRSLAITPADPVSAELREIVNQMVHPKPKKRFRTAADVLQALRPLRGRGPASDEVAGLTLVDPPRDQDAAPTQVARRRPAPSDSARRSPRSFGVVMIVAAVAVVGGAIALLALEREPAPQARVAPARELGTLVQREKPPPAVAEPEPADAPDRPSTKCGSRRGPGTFTLREHDVVRWDAHVPKTYDGSREVPVVVIVADPFNSRPDFLEESGFMEVADREGFVAVVPVLRDASHVTDWDAMIGTQEIAGVLDEVRAEVCINVDHVYVFGDGGGANKARWMACTPWVAAIVTYHDRPGKIHCNQRRMPHLHFSPRDSDYVPLDGSPRCMEFRGQLEPMDGYDERWRKQNACASKRQTTRPHTSVECHEFDGCEARYVTCRTAGGYGWASSQVRWVHETLCGQEKPPAQAPVAQLSWDFFASVPPPKVKPSRSKGCGNAIAPGTQRLSLSESPLSLRSELVHIPTNYHETRPHPLVVLLHRDAQSPEQILELTKFRELADDRGIIIWTPYDSVGGMYPWRETAASLELLREGFDKLSTKACIDTDRVYAVGHRSGGHMIAPLSCEPWVTATATNAFRTNTSEHPCPGRATPSIHLSPLHSRRMLVAGGKDCLVADEPLSLATHERIWVDANRCKSTEKYDERGYKGGVCRSYKHCKSDYVSCRLEGGAGWPGSGIDPPDPTGQCGDRVPQFPAELAIWDFFVGLRR